MGTSHYTDDEISKIKALVNMGKKATQILKVRFILARGGVLAPNVLTP